MRRESPNLSESSLARWAAVIGFAALTLGPFGLATRIWQIAADQTCWLDGIMYAGSWGSAQNPIHVGVWGQEPPAGLGLGPHPPPPPPRPPPPPPPAVIGPRDGKEPWKRKP